MILILYLDSLVCLPTRVIRVAQPNTAGGHIHTYCVHLLSLFLKGYTLRFSMDHFISFATFDLIKNWSHFLQIKQAYLILKCRKI